MTNQPGTPLFGAGESARYLGPTSFLDGEGFPFLKPGMVGKVTEVYPGWVTPDGHIHDGHNRVVFPNGYSRPILPKHSAKYERV